MQGLLIPNLNRIFPSLPKDDCRPVAVHTKPPGGTTTTVGTATDTLMVVLLAVEDELDNTTRYAYVPFAFPLMVTLVVKAEFPLRVPVRIEAFPSNNVQELAL